MSTIQSSTSAALLQLLTQSGANKKTTATATESPATPSTPKKIPTAADLIQELFKQTQGEKTDQDESSQTISSQILSIAQYLNPKTRAFTIAKMLPFLQTSAQMLISETTSQASESAFGFPSSPSLNLFI